jgi:hypothetical protein
VSGTGVVQFRRFDRACARERRDIVPLIRDDDNASRGVFATKAPLCNASTPTYPAPISILPSPTAAASRSTNLGMGTAPDTAWWDGLTTEPEPGFTVEDGHGLSPCRRLWSGRIGPGIKLPTPPR